ncbi:helix-turn-helix domain-containing protein [Streptomyces telluris]|uniref:Helix-turn-helix transcriptional regulator n=1 Tax=Streptomyces telluris TaxID=2720021 RepID=A0A9X2LKT3_9ACTN|nr:helix-turn-helix transcriptional regulator [Streptomyces telluris]MCQ8772764.1 helix-turn-helix transcriptional regulator [Streptomyces telluris]NJP78419.1 helix-turn-helix domain-containing protein [Streptomyces telluris]
MSSSPFSSAQAARAAIASRLDEIRRDAGLTGHELAARCGWHKSKSSRIARGRTLPSDADIRSWCAACGAEEQAADLIAASRTAESMYVQWKQIHRDGMRRVHQKTTPLYQRTRHFRVYASNLIPGMLQTAEYATGLLRSITEFQQTPDDVEAAVKARLDRSRVVREGDHRFALLIEEAVLYYRVCDDAAMAGQLGYLLSVMAQANVSLGVIPFGARRRIWPLEAFYAFDEGLVAVETLTAEINVAAPGEVGTYLKAFAELSQIAVHGAQARAHIIRAIDSLA